MPKCSVSIDLSGIPEVVADLRKEFAQIVRDVADDEAPAVARRLREIADAFAGGQRPEGY